MRSLAEKLGYSVATIYAHFENKQQLLNEIALHGFRALYERVSPALEIRDPVQAVEGWTRAYIDFAFEQREVYKLMFHDIQISLAELNSDDREWMGRFWEMMRDAYARGFASGAFDTGDPETEASIGWAATHGFVQLVNSGRLPVQSRRGSAELTKLREAFVASRMRSLRRAAAG